MEAKLTKTQREALENLKANGRLYIGYNSPDIIRTFESLVSKSLARVDGTTSTGKYYRKA